MPIPMPHDGEAQDDFMERCMGNATMMGDYEDMSQRAAVCHEAWRDRNKAEATMLEHKSLKVDLKGEKGEFVARIVTLDAVDSDGDITPHGAFPLGAEVVVSAYMHGSWSGGLPVGKAKLLETDNSVIAEGQFNLGTTSGRDTYETVKFTGGLQEWSYGFSVLESGQDTIDGKQVRILKSVKPFEISPVLRGAGVNTATLAIKSDDKAMSFADHAERVLLDMEAFIGRCKSLADLRAKEGRVMSDVNRERLTGLQAKLRELESEIAAMLAIAPDKDRAKGLRLLTEYTRLRTRIQTGER